MAADAIQSLQSEEELVELLHADAPIQVLGSGTKRHHGPAGPAGTRLVDLQAELAKRQQWLPLDPPYADATIGGILASNSSGPRRYGYGTVRDHLLGTRSVGADGVVTRSGGRVVKNVTGFDLHKLHIGAFGSLGIVTEASFKLRPKPDISAAFVFPCASVEEAHALLLRVFDS